MNAVTPLKLPETLPAGCLTSATVGKWNTSLLEWATPKFLPLLTKGLSYTIETSRKELRQAFSTFDSAMETHLFTASTRLLQDLTILIHLWLLTLKMKNPNFENSTSNKATLAAELFRVKQYWIRVEQELLTYSELVY